MSEITAPSLRAARYRAVALAFAIDLVLVVIFAAIGRASHEKAPLDAGLFITAWPFIAGLVIGWLGSLGWRRPFSIVRTGLPLWLITVAAGMLLRAASDQGTAVPFIIVATVTLGVFLVGWRAIAALIRRARKPRA